LDDTRARILAAAGPVFAEKGFKATTVREICDAAGVNIASVNYYFGDKQRLYIEAVKEASRLRAMTHPFPDRPPGTPSEVRLQDFIKTLLSRMIGEVPAPWQMGLMRREMLQPTQACREMVEEYIRPDFERLLAILEEMLPGDTPRHIRRKVGFSIVGQCLYYRVAGDVVEMLVSEEERKAHFSVEKLADHILRFTLRGLGRNPDGPTEIGDEQVVGSAKLEG
jgi:AcrR family transcriptional regulator